MSKMASTGLKPIEASKTAAKRPMYGKASSAIFGHNYIRDQLTLKTWLALGAAIQMTLFTLPVKPYYAATPVLAYLVWEVIGTVLIMIGLRADPLQAKMLETKYTALLPDEEGKFRLGSNGDKVSVFFLGFRNHHHLSLFAPGYQGIVDRARKMFKELEERADELGLLGISNYASTGNTTKNPEVMTIMYFKSNDDVIRYANGPLHREAWEWFNKVTKQYPHLGIMHELYEVPAGSWENVYKNIEPTLLAATKHKVIDEDGQEQWISPVVDATKGKTSNHHGRIA